MIQHSEPEKSTKDAVHNCVSCSVLWDVEARENVRLSSDFVPSRHIRKAWQAACGHCGRFFLLVYTNIGDSLDIYLDSRPPNEKLTQITFENKTALVGRFPRLMSTSLLISAGPYCFTPATLATHPPVMYEVHSIWVADDFSITFEM